MMTPHKLVRFVHHANSGILMEQWNTGIMGSDQYSIIPTLHAGVKYLSPQILLLSIDCRNSETFDYTCLSSTGLISLGFNLTGTLPLKSVSSYVGFSTW